MPTDVREVLRDAAGRPADPIDVDHIWHRARRQRAAYRGGALLSVIALVGSAAIVIPNLLTTPRVDVVDPPASAVATEAWVDIQVAEAVMSVPPEWQIEELGPSGPMPACGEFFVEAPTFFVADAIWLTPCLPAAAEHLSSLPRLPGIYAVPLDAVDPSDVAAPHEPVEVNGIEGERGHTGFGDAAYRFPSVGLFLIVSYGEDRGTVERVLGTLREAAPSEPAWQTVVVGKAQLSVPAEWEIVDLRSSPDALGCNGFAYSGKPGTLFTYDLSEPQVPKCAPPLTESQELRAQAYPIAVREDPRGDREINGHPVSVIQEYASTQYRFESLGIAVRLNEAADPELADRILATVAPAEDAPRPDTPATTGDWREVDLGEMTVTIPSEWEVIDPGEDVTAICSRFLGDPTLYLWDAVPPPSCPAPPPEAPRSVGAHVTRRDAPFDASRGAQNDAVISIQSGPTLYERDNGDGTRTYRVDGSTLELLVSYDPDPGIAQRVAHSLRQDDESETADWREVDLGSAVISIPPSWSVVDVDEEPEATCTMFSDQPSLYVEQAARGPRTPPTCTPSGTRHVVGVHVQVDREMVHGSEGVDVVVNGISATCGEGDGGRHCDVHVIPLLVWLNYGADPNVASEVFTTLRRDDQASD